MSHPAVRRRVFPLRLTIRWFTTRGWAFGAAATFGIAAYGLQPPFLFETYGWTSTLLFAVAGASMFGLALRPESTWWRVGAVAWTVAAGVSRASALLLVSAPHNAWRSRLIAAAVWLFVAYCCWLLAVTTASIPNRRGK